MDHPAGLIDPHRPWIKDARDDPAAMNWAQTLFNPMGETSKLHFSRAWTFMFMGRVLLYILPVVTVSLVMMAGVKAASLMMAPVDLLLLSVPAMILPFVLFTLVTEYTSFVAHVRRLADAKRPVWLAGIVLLPLILGMVFYMLGAQRGAAQFRAAQAQVEADAATAADAATLAETGVDTGDTVTPSSAEEAKAPAQGPQFTSEREAAMVSGTGLAMMVWALVSFGVMLWTLLYVARLPNQGVGAVRTGSDLTPEEAAAIGQA